MPVRYENAPAILQHRTVGFQFEQNSTQSGNYGSPLVHKQQVQFEAGIESAIAALSGVHLKTNQGGTGTFVSLEHVLVTAEVPDQGDKVATVTCEFQHDPGISVFTSTRQPPLSR